MSTVTTRRFAAAAVALAAVGGGALPAVAAATATPRNGLFVGSEAGPAGALPVSFTVVKRAKVTAFQAPAQVKAGCHGIQSYQSPFGPFKIGAKGGFTGVLSNFPKPAPTVKVTGTFVSPTKATGVITIKFAKKFAKKKACNSSRRFTATLQP